MLRLSPILAGVATAACGLLIACSGADLGDETGQAVNLDATMGGGDLGSADDVAPDAGAKEDGESVSDLGPPQLGADVPDTVTKPSDESDGSADALPQCNDDECDIAGVCYGNLEGSPDDPCLACLVVVVRDAWSPRDGGDCDDEDACTREDTCWDGACIGTPVSCDDGNPCTVGQCQDGSGECAYAPLATDCDDGDPCTAGDKCVGTSCVGGAQVTCDDANPCTESTCDADLGCVTLNKDGKTCDDGSACTNDDACLGGVCAGGSPVVCDDEDICTIDTCHIVSGCEHESLAELCTDDNPCTDDACDAALGCVYPANTAPCDDGSACTAQDVCTDGSCLGVPVVTDDGNPCTDDSCDPLVGVLHVDNALPCSDGDACTVGDQCAASSCVPGAVPLQCDDDNECTHDACSPQDGCQNEHHSEPCDDGLSCTDGDACLDGACVGEPLVCDDGNVCTADACVEGEGCGNTIIVSNACRPVITVTYPPRAATLEASTAYIDVVGTVSSGAGDILSITVNGEPATLDGEVFSAPITPVVGGNTIVIEAADALGTTRSHVQAFHWASSYTAPSGKATPGIGIWMAQETIDDGDHTMPPDDLATLFGLVLDGYPLDGLVSGQMGTTTILGADYDVKVKNFKAGPRAIALDAQPGALRMTVTITDVSADIDMTTGAWWAPNIHGSADIDQILVTGDILVTVVDHALVASLEGINVDIQGTDFTFDNSAADFLLGWIADLLVGNMVSELESSFEGEFADQLEPLLADALSTLAFSTSFEMPSLDPAGGGVTIDLTTDFNSVLIQDAGASFKLRANASTTDVNGYDNLGAVKREGCGEPPQNMFMPKTGPFELGFSDDTFNLLLYAAWEGGLLEFDVPPEMLADVDLSQYGLASDAIDIHLSGMLAPVVSDCAGTGLVLHLGDLQITANLALFGQTIDVVMYASFSAGVELSVQDGVVGLAVAEIQGLESQISVVQEDLVASESAIAALIDENLVPALLGALGGGALGGFPLPEIELTDTMLNLPPGTLPPGTAIGIDPQTSNHEDGNVYISGTLK